jgi:hypothetical protein
MHQQTSKDKTQKNNSKEEKKRNRASKMNPKSYIA